MIIVSYDFENNKRRSDFSKYLKSYGHRLQYSVYEIKNSKRILTNVLKEIELKHKNKFKNCDSIIVMNLCQHCQKNILRYGSAKNEIGDLILFE